MVAFGLGEMPGTDLAVAADIIAGECSLMFLPQLPARGIASEAVGRTLALMPDLPIDPRVRTWVLTARPQRETRRLWDRLEADLDECEAAWQQLDTLKIQVVGPWSLAATIELSNGHRAVTDNGALRDITESLIHGIAEHCSDLQRRFHCDIELQIDEPLVVALAAGSLAGTSDFDRISRIPQQVLGERLNLINDAFTDRCPIRLNCTEVQPLWEVIQASGVGNISVNPAMLTTTADIDGLGHAIARGCRIGLGITSPGVTVDTTLERPRTLAQYVAKFWDKLGFDRLALPAAVDIHPVSGLAHCSALDAAAALKMARVVDEMIAKDAGDL
ncbi:MAG: hypothetical protein Q4A92_03485 [Corynebacterium sp.]|nr:hypothetical protein [Corynebacterium sp.]